MAFYEDRVYRSSSMSHVEDPGAAEEQGFVDDDPMHSLVHLRHPREQLWFCDGEKLVLMMGVLSVVGIAVGLGIIFGKAEAPSHDHTNGKPEGWLKDPPPLPSNLHAICAPLNLVTDEGYNACLEMCNLAQCCDYIPESELSCVDTHRKDCERYRSSCQHLDHVKATKSEATPDKACSTDSLLTVVGAEACNDVCESFGCCFDGSTECGVSEAVCADNGACATALLLDSDGLNSQDEAKETIESACQDLNSYEGQTMCTNVCSPAVCCFLSPNAWTKPCPVSCDHYEACSQLYGPILQGDVDGNSTFSVPHQVEQACNPAQLETLEGVRECFDLCQHHLCCFDQLEARGCASINKEECPLYSACRALTDLEDSSEQPAEICEPKLVEQTGPSECMKACSKSYCCLFDARFESSCANDSICSSFYKPCEILAPEKLPPEDSDLIANIETVCTTSNLGSMLGATECENECLERGCCIENGAGNCQTSDLDYCREVESCQLLFQVDPTPQIDEPNPEDNAITDELRSVCAPENLGTLSGFHNCYDQCYYHLCCFSNSDFLNCKDDKGVGECDEYAPCEVLLETTGGDVNLEEVCSSTSVESTSGLKACRDGCASHLCCFQDPNLPSSCLGLFGQRECDMYDPCKTLVSDSSHAIYNEEDPYLVALIDNYCKPENVANETTARHCMLQCEKRGCCFLTGDCYDSNRDWCDEVIACTNHPLINAPMPSNVTSVEEMSSNGKSNLGDDKQGGNAGPSVENQDGDEHDKHSSAPVDATVPPSGPPSGIDESATPLDGLP